MSVVVKTLNEAERQQMEARRRSHMWMCTVGASLCLWRILMAP